MQDMINSDFGLNDGRHAWIIFLSDVFESQVARNQLLLWSCLASDSTRLCRAAPRCESIELCECGVDV